MNAGIAHYIAVQALVQDTPRLGQAKAAERDWSASPRARKAPVVRESKTINALAYLSWCVLWLGVAWFITSGTGQALPEVLRGAP